MADLYYTEVYRVSPNGPDGRKSSLLRYEASEKNKYSATNPQSGSGDWVWVDNVLNDINYRPVMKARMLNPNGSQQIDKSYSITWENLRDSEFPTPHDLKTDIELSFDNGQSWKRIATEVGGTSLNYNFSNEQETSIGRIRVRAALNGVGGNWSINSGVFTIQHAFAPGIPSNLKPSGGSYQDRQGVIKLEWKHNHPMAQSKFTLEWSTNQTTWNEVTQRTTNQYTFISANTFPLGNIYWRVKTTSDAGIDSLYSNNAIFRSVEATNAPTITSANTTILSRPTVSWSQSDQVAYQVLIDDNINTNVYDSGEANSTNRALTITTNLLNNSTYKIKVRTKSLAGLWSVYSEQMLTTNFIEPAIPALELVEGNGVIAINIGNSQPVGTQPIVSWNDVYRDGVRIATNIKSGNYKDYTIESERVYNYQVMAVVENGSESSSEIKQASIILHWSMLTDLQGNTIDLKLKPSRNENINYNAHMMKFQGRTKRVAQFEEAVDEDLPLSFTIMNDEDKDRLKIMGASKQTLIYRDNRKRKMFGIVGDLKIDDDIRHTNHYNVSFTFQEVDFNEVV